MGIGEGRVSPRFSVIYSLESFGRGNACVSACPCVCVCVCSGVGRVEVRAWFT